MRTEKQKSMYISPALSVVNNSLTLYKATTAREYIYTVVLITIFTSLCFTSLSLSAREHWTYSDLSKASITMAQKTSDAVDFHSTGTLPDSVFWGHWSALQPGSLAHLSKAELRGAATDYYSALPVSIPDSKRKNAKSAYLEFLISRWTEDREC